MNIVGMVNVALQILIFYWYRRHIEEEEFLKKHTGCMKFTGENLGNTIDLCIGYIMAFFISISE